MSPVALRFASVVLWKFPADNASPSSAATRPVAPDAATTAPPAAAPAASLSRLRREPAGGPLGTVSTCEAGTRSTPDGRGAGWSFARSVSSLSVSEATCASSWWMRSCWSLTGSSLGRWVQGGLLRRIDLKQRPSAGSDGVPRGCGSGRAEIVPAELVGRPEAVEVGVDGVAEAEPVAVVVPPALLRQRHTGACQPSRAVRIPRSVLLQAQFEVRRGVGEVGTHPVTGAQQHPSERLAGVVDPEVGEALEVVERSALGVDRDP